MVMFRRSAGLLLGVLFTMSPLLASGAVIGFADAGGEPGCGRFAVLDEDVSFPGRTDRFRSPVFDGYRPQGGFRSRGESHALGTRKQDGRVPAGATALPGPQVPVSVPEAGTMILLVSGLVGLVAFRSNEPMK